MVEQRQALLSIKTDYKASVWETDQYWHRNRWSEEESPEMDFNLYRNLDDDQISTIWGTIGHFNKCRGITGYWGKGTNFIRLLCIKNKLTKDERSKCNYTRTSRKWMSSNFQCMQRVSNCNSKFRSKQEDKVTTRQF